ncbi:TPA: DUF1919 domain-containing protein, partial [Streptococcus suis]
KILRVKRDYINKKRLKNDQFTIFSSNCIGGVIYNSLGKQFLSPTINVYFDAPDFILFLKNPEKYLSTEPQLIETLSIKYPVVQIDDIKIYCVHYSSFDHFIEDWNKRKARINWNNIFLMMSERDGCTDKDIEEFEQLPYANKVIFVSEPMPHFKSAYYIEGSEVYNSQKKQVGTLTSFKSKYSGKRIIDDFDYVSFLNREGNCEEK